MKTAYGRGFTLIEVLTVISILVIVASFMVRGSSPAKQTIALEQTTNQIADMYRTARQYSLSAKEHNGVYPSYGVSVSPQSADATVASIARMYARTDAVTNGDNTCYDDGDTDNYEIQSLEFSDGVFIDSVQFNMIRSASIEPRPVSSDQNGDVFFLRPYPTVFMSRSNKNCGGPAPWGTAEIQIVVENAAGNQRLITVSTNGNVRVSTP